MQDKQWNVCMIHGARGCQDEVIPCMRWRRKHTWAEKEVTSIQRSCETAPLELGVGRTGIACAHGHLVVHRNPGQAVQPRADLIQSLQCLSMHTVLQQDLWFLGCCRKSAAKHSKIRYIQAACELSDTSSPPMGWKTSCWTKDFGSPAV